MSTPFAGSVQVIGSTGPVAGALIDTFVSGTLIQQAAYTSASLSIPHENPIECDSLGRAAVWLNPALTYRIRYRNADGTIIPYADFDNVSTAVAAPAVPDAGDLVYKSQTVEGKLDSLPASPADTATADLALTSTNGAFFPAGTYSSAAALAPAAKATVRGAGRENTFIRTTHASNAVFSSAAQFVTYEHMTVDRAAGVAGQGINHAGVSNTQPLEGFVARHINANGHGECIKLRDFVLAAIEDSYLQSGTRGLDTDKTGANFCTVLNVRRTWMRGNTDYNAYVGGVIGSLWEQAIFEGAGGIITNVGLYVSGGGRHQFLGCWWESLKQAGQFVDCGEVLLMGGHWDGAEQTASSAFYATGAVGPVTLIFDGAWDVANHAGTFALADAGATIIVRSPDLLGLTFQALNGGKVIFDCPLVGSATYDPPSMATLTQAVATTVTVTGASAGDLCTASFDNGTTDPQNFDISAYCFAPDTVTVRMFNRSGGTIDLASGTLSVRVQKRALVS